MAPCVLHEWERFLDRFEAMARPEGTADLLRWAWENFAPKVVLSSSFQTQSLPLLHLVSRTCPQMPVLFIDTGFHFPETLAFRDEVVSMLGLKLVIVRPLLDRETLLARYGDDLPHRNPDLCCRLNKVEPMRRALRGMAAWISGVRRDQTSHRRTLRVLECRPDGLLRIHPMLNWTAAEVEAYRQRYHLPAHPLYERGYLSIGCRPCTKPAFVAHPRSGRWDGRREECGLHLPWEGEGGA